MRSDRSLRRIVAATGLVVLSVLAVGIAGAFFPASSDDPTPEASPLPATPSPEPADVPPVTPPPQHDPALAIGSSGPAVAEVQERLRELGYWTGDPTGSFGSGTRHAVVALQKAAGLVRDGIVGERTHSTLDAAVRPDARSDTGRVMEVDLRRQILILVSDGEVSWVLDASTGSAQTPTPTGRYSVYREIDGVRISALGRLVRPKYFHRGYAIHGYPHVPAHPVSHGCVRVTNDAIDWLWANDLLPRGTDVWVY